MEKPVGEKPPLFAKKRREPRDETRRDRCFEFETRCKGVMKGFVWASSVEKARLKLHNGEYQTTSHRPVHMIIGDDLVLQRREDLEPPVQPKEMGEEE